MRLLNRFDEDDKARLATHKNYCWKCGNNQGCSFHHILGTTTDSILTAILLCHNCHREADNHNVSDKEFQSELLQIAIREILEAGVILKEKDIHFYESHRIMYNINNERQTNISNRGTNTSTS